jgi:hypothetical protein
METAASIFAIVSALLSAGLLMTAQLGMSPALTYAGLAIPPVVAPLLHFTIDKRHADPSARSFAHYLGPLATRHIRAWWIAAAVFNFLWAVRWLFGVEFVVSSIYGLNSAEVQGLRECGMEYPYVTKHPSCPIVLSSFLAHPWAVYIHCSGAACTLALG